MKEIHKRRAICGIVLALNTYACLGYATSWPVFSPPTDSYLMSHHIIDKRSCPPGQGKINAGTVINMQELCGTYCPSSWAWVASSDGECKSIENGFTLQGIEISHFPDEDDGDDGIVLYSEVKAYYGAKDSEQHSMELTFTAPKQHWYCVQLNADLPNITCANDI